jgi:polyphosphate kinase
MMRRNLDGRVETLFPVEDPLLREAVYERILKPFLADTINTQELQPDGHYTPVQPEPGETPFDCQNWFITHPLSDSNADEGISTMSALPSGT